MQIDQTALAGVLTLTPARQHDARGWLSETYAHRVLAAAGLDAEFVQENHSHSATKGTLRGLHFQAPPHAQGKLVRCSQGAIWDVVVDIRRGSRTFGQWLGQELSAENARQIWVPAGFLHGFVTRTDACEVQYKLTSYYAPDHCGAVAWDSCGIDWGLDRPPLVSPADAAAPRLADFHSPFQMEPSP